MNWTERFDRLMQEKLPFVRVENDAVMAKYTSFRIGGPAKRMVFPQNEKDVTQLIALCREAKIFWMVIGKGTNLLIGDEGVDGVVMNMAELSAIELRDDGTIYAEAGAQLSRIAVTAQGAGLAGFAFAHGIPGSLGGAVAMNAGAYGGEMKQVLRSVTALFADGVRTLDLEELQLGYRHSIFSETEGVILSAVIALSEGDPGEIRAEMDDLMARRKKSQPLEFPSAGSTFKRPEGYFAGTMIDQCGLKGTSVGGAEVSEKHAGFIVNKGGATCEDVLGLIALVQKRVQEKFGVALEPEVKIIRSL